MPAENNYYNLPTDLIEGIAYTIKVKALGAGNYSDSAYSEGIDYVKTTTSLSAPGNLRVEDGVFKWDAVANATRYKVIIDNGMEQSVNFALSYDLSALGLGTHSLKVKAVGGGNYSDSPYAEYPYNKTQPLLPPASVQVNGTNLTWSPVTGASGYNVSVNDTEYSVIVTSYSLADLPVGVYTVKVKALGDNVRYTDSAYSSAVTYKKMEQFDAPAGVTVDGTTLKWNTVQYAAGYKVSINGVTGSDVINENFCSVTTLLELFAVGEYTFEVMAVAGTDDNYTDSAYSTNSGAQYVKTEKLAAPVVNISGEILTWTPVQNAVNGYTVTVNGGTYPVSQRTNTVSFTMPSNLTLGTVYAIKVKAVGVGTYVLASDEFTEQYTEYTRGLGFELNGTGYTVSSIGAAYDDGAIWIPSSHDGLPVTQIGESAFEGRGGLTAIVIPASIINIGDDAFAECSSFTHIDIPEGVISMGRRVFADSGLTSITLPASMSNIDFDEIFAGCDRLASITIADEHPDYASYNGIVHYKATATVCYVPKGISGEVRIADGIEDIPWGAFSGCTGLTSIIIPESVYVIGDGAFSGCTGLTSIIIPESVYVIGDGVFSGCTSLLQIIFYGYISWIGDGVFSGCNRLTEICIAMYTSYDQTAWSPDWLDGCNPDVTVYWGEW